MTFLQSLLAMFYIALIYPGHINPVLFSIKLDAQPLVPGFFIVTVTLNSYSCFAFFFILSAHSFYTNMLVVYVICFFFQSIRISINQEFLKRA